MRRIVLPTMLLLLAACSNPEEKANKSYLAGRDLLAKGDLAGAAARLKEAVRVKADLLPAWRALAEVEERNHNVMGLGSTLRTVLDLEPSDATVRVKVVRLLLLAHNYN